MLNELALLHSTFSPMEEATAPAWPIRMADVCDYWSEAVRGGVEAALQRYQSRLSAENLATIEAAGKIARSFYLMPQSRLTLTHGDARVDNVLFEQRDGRTGSLPDEGNRGPDGAGRSGAVRRDGGDARIIGDHTH